MLTPPPSITFLVNKYAGWFYFLYIDCIEQNDYAACTQFSWLSGQPGKKFSDTWLRTIILWNGRLSVSSLFRWGRGMYDFQKWITSCISRKNKVQLKRYFNAIAELMSISSEIALKYLILCNWTLSILRICKGIHFWKFSISSGPLCMYHFLH